VPCTGGRGTAAARAWAKVSNGVVPCAAAPCRIVLNIAVPYPAALDAVASTRWTVTFCQAPRPLGGGTPRVFRTLAMPVKLMIPSAWITLMIGSRAAARAAARSVVCHGSDRPAAQVRRQVLEDEVRGGVLHEGIFQQDVEL
jgi:hypothetical protein